jgi:hypothetical protein
LSAASAASANSKYLEGLVLALAHDLEFDFRVLRPAHLLDRLVEGEPLHRHFVEMRDDRKVRIFVFDKLQWCMDFNQLQKLSPARPHFSILDALAINNPRMVPQHALSSVTNVDDIESYIKQRETEQGKTYLQVVDLPASERRLILQELSLMGITAGSLFPGIDGACMQLRARFFEL